ncbi:MAG: metallophosphoesterase family protein [Bacteroidota bacterium]
MAIYAIGDIHGCDTALRTLWTQLNPQAGDTVVCLGDYVDRGPCSMEAIDFLLSKTNETQLIFIKGNHDIMMLEARENLSDLAEWLRHGGENSLDSYGVEDESKWKQHIPATHWDFLQHSLPYHRIRSYLFVHGGLDAGVALVDQSESVLYWEKQYEPKPYSEEYTVICGHTSRRNGEIADFGHTICIDTYAYGGMWLTGLNVETKEFVQTNEKGEFKRGQLGIT